MDRLPKMLMIPADELCDKHLLQEKTDLMELIWMVLDMSKPALHDQCKSTLLYLTEHELIYPLKFHERWTELSLEQVKRGWQITAIPFHVLDYFPLPHRNVIITKAKIDANYRMLNYLCSKCREHNALDLTFSEFDPNVCPSDINTNFEWNSLLLQTDH